LLDSLLQEIKNDLVLGSTQQVENGLIRKDADPLGVLSL